MAVLETSIGSYGVFGKDSQGSLGFQGQNGEGSSGDDTMNIKYNLNGLEIAIETASGLGS